MLTHLRSILELPYRRIGHFAMARSKARAMQVQKYTLERSDPPLPRFGGQAAPTAVILGCTVGRTLLPKCQRECQYKILRSEKFSAAPLRTISSAGN
jgi:hypothetical protein